MHNPHDYRIYIDVDGVLAQFVESAFKFYDREYKDSNYPACEYDIAKVLDMTPKSFWARLDNAFWLDMPLYSWAEKLVAEMHNYGNVYLATSPPEDPRVASYRLNWIRYHFPALFRRTVLTPNKNVLAHDRAILIDDSDQQTMDFCQADGYAILFPRPWNSNWDVMEMLPTADSYVEHTAMMVKRILGEEA